MKGEGPIYNELEQKLYCNLFSFKQWDSRSINIFIFMESLTLNVTRGTEQVDATSFYAPVSCWCELWWMFLSSHWTIITTARSPIYISTLSFLVHDVQGPSLGAFFIFFPPDSKCHPRVDIPPNTHCSACNMHHFQCSLVWPLGVEAKHKYTELKMAAWWMRHVWHSRVNKQ